MDLNSDGQRDILSGSYSRMGESMAGLFQVLWGTSGGKFKKAAVLNGTDGEPLIIPIKSKSDQVQNICTRPWAVDWNADGELDLVVGNFAGSFYVFTGKGKGKFAPKPDQIMSDGQPLAIKGHHSDPFMVDWDGDGDLDLLSGADKGGVQWSENTAGRGKTPKLTEFKSIIEPPSQSRESWQLVSEDELTEPSNSTRVWADDLNGDGKLDILVGDNISLYSPAKGVSKEEYPKKLAEWRKRYTEASEASNKARGDEAEQAARKGYMEIYKQRTEFMNEDRTGYVWLYLRK